MNAGVVAALFGSGLALLTAVTSTVALLYKRGANEGRITEILSQLTAMGADHEARLRALEKGN